jgi:hypothetical protein
VRRKVITGVCVCVCVCACACARARGVVSSSTVSRRYVPTAGQIPVFGLRPPPPRQSKTFGHYTMTLAAPFRLSHLPYYLPSITSLLPRFVFNPLPHKLNPGTPTTTLPHRHTFPSHFIQRCFYIFCRVCG